ncbi:MAG TPA: M61 family peptidase [Thermoanaerobaculia bacterium]|nr:M61 family peptidase [Thermoanaerobaculia bacterium]
MIKPGRTGLLLSSLLLAGLLPSGLSAAAGPTPPATLVVDASEAPREILHAHLVMPVTPGPLTLFYPKWLPGEHGPNGPVTELAGLKFTAGGAPLAWRRDTLDMFAFHLTVPAGTTSLAIDLDFLAPGGEGIYTSGRSTSAQLAILSWNSLVLYPQGKPTDDLTFVPSLRLPAGWKYATALPVAREGEGTVDFKPVSLTTLVDSPVLLGAHMRTVVLSSEPPVHQIDIAADTEGALVTPPDFQTLYQNLVAESGALFGARHYRDYHFLLTLSDHTAHFGLEHHESSDDRIDEKSLLKEDGRRNLASLLSHEFVHSWNGKHRRPADLMSPDLHSPMQGDLLWVYEGLTQYLGFILAPRSGLWTAEFTRERIAQVAATLDNEPGRSWRPLEDTAIAVQTLGGAPAEWGSWRRGTDYYDESVLIWLEVDATLRQKTGGRVSMDDFCHRFHGGTSGPPEVKTYTFDDIVATLNGLAPYDWRGLLTERLHSTSPHAPLGGLAASGWKLVYTEVPNLGIKDKEERFKSDDWSFSLGIQVGEDGTIHDVLPGSPAAKAGVGPGGKLLAVNGRAWKDDWVNAALREAKGGKAPIELLVVQSDYYTTYKVDYHDGPRYPHLERDPAQPDLLEAILAPHARAAGK